MRRTLKHVLLFVILASVQVHAQVATQMEALNGLVGEWTGTMAMTMPGTTTPMEMVTTVSVKSFGPYQETVYTMDMGAMGKFTGHTFLTWDGTAKNYRSWTFDDQANEPRNETGKWDGKKLVMTSAPQGGMVTRITYEPKSKDEIAFMIELKNGDAFVKMGEATYKRKAS